VIRLFLKKSRWAGVKRSLMVMVVNPRSLERV